jgi:hypothetical protein
MSVTTFFNAAKIEVGHRDAEAHAPPSSYMRESEATHQHDTFNIRRKLNLHRRIEGLDPWDLCPRALVCCASTMKTSFVA